MTVPAAASAVDPTAGGRHVSIVAEGMGDVTEPSRGNRGARMTWVPAGTDADGNTVGMAAAGVDAINLALLSATPVHLFSILCKIKQKNSVVFHRKMWLLQTL